MWNKPWKYREGFAISIGLLITGALLQVSIGPMEWLVFMWPANIIALAVWKSHTNLTHPGKVF